MTSKEKLLRARILEMSGVDPKKCMKCGKCTASCPSYGEMDYHPHEYVYMVEKGRIEALLSSDAMYKCLGCFSCIDRCPRGVQPAKLIEAVRQLAVREKEGNRLSPNDIPAVLDEKMPQQALVGAFRKFAK